MIHSFKIIKIILVSSLMIILSSCEDTLDTSSVKAKEQSIKMMMVDIHPQNQKRFAKALDTLYLADQIDHSTKSIEEITSITNEKIKGKTVEEILVLSFASNKKVNDYVEALNNQALAEADDDADSEATLKDEFKGIIVKVGHKL
ncbi:MAG: hypothetical protein ISR69_00365 [Gammaproteobacteria bacterium]|nr:hypothetical protein [Gammaproteobacteria bacterium]